MSTEVGMATQTAFSMEAYGGVQRLIVLVATVTAMLPETRISSIQTGMTGNTRRFTPRQLVSPDLFVSTAKLVIPLLDHF